MSKRFIDADALIKELEHCSYETWSKGVNRMWWAHTVKVKDNIVQCIQRQPTADVAEVKQGEWIEAKRAEWIEGRSLNECSVCGERGFPDWLYCPCCGAKMDGERNSENE